MSDETKVVEGAQDGSSEASNSQTNSDMVPKHQYVGLQAKFNKVEGEYKEKVSNLEKQLTGAVSAEEHNKIKTELDGLKAEKTTRENAEKERAVQDLSNRKSELIKKGVPETDIKDLDSSGVALIEKTLGLGLGKPKPDLQGRGGGTAVPKGSPMELARSAYASSNRK